MTIIAWDGTSLAADKMACSGGQRFTITKIARVGEFLVGVAGRGDKIRAFQQWIADGRVPLTYPIRDDKENFFAGIVIGRDRVIQLYEDVHLPMICEDGVHALGSGRDYARAALHLGKSAREAVEVTSLFSVDCGLGVDVLPLYEDGVCSRCAKFIEQFRPPAPGCGTAGYYDVTGGSWAKYANPGETYVCDRCMWEDPTYIIDHGRQS